MLAFVFCFGAIVFETESQVVAESGADVTVKVGLYVYTTTDTRRFAAKTESDNGFEFGVMNGDRFEKTFSISDTEIIILPRVNAYYNAENGKCRASTENANIGAYSSFVSSHSTYSEAAAKAKAVGGFVLVKGDCYEVRSNPTTEMNEEICEGITILDPSGRIILQFDLTERKMALRGRLGCPVTLPVIHRSGAVFTFPYQGVFEYSLSDNKLFMVSYIGLEDYTKCVMANEIGTNVSVETRKAFSVLARTLALGKKHEENGFDVCPNSACCQVYQGLNRISEENNEIVDETRGLICAYNGKPISVLYHNSNGGASCSSVAAWGGNEVPYLTTVFLDEAGEADKWELSFTKQEFYDYMLSRRTFSAVENDNISLKIHEKDPYGSNYNTFITVTDGSGNVIEVRTSEDVRSALGFDSANFDIEYSKEIVALDSNGKLVTQKITGVLTADGYKEFDGFTDEYKTVSGECISPDKIVIKGEGKGHGVGFSATGSELLAKDGYSYKYILEFFFNGTSLINVG